MRKIENRIIAAIKGGTNAGRSIGHRSLMVRKLKSRQRRR